MEKQLNKEDTERRLLPPPKSVDKEFQIFSQVTFVVNPALRLE
jgi:hypothetical protein